MNNMEDIIIPLAGMLIGIIIPLAIFLWLYHENKNKYAAVIEISKNLDDPSKAEENTIRKLFGISIDKNSVHGSDSPDNAKKEIHFFFQN